MVMADLKFEKSLGKGSFGSVGLFKYTRQTDGKTFEAAVKTSDDKNAKALYKEFHILSKFKGCTRIVQCYGDKVQEILNNKGYLEYKLHMEYASEGSLKNFMNRFKDKKLPEPMIRKFTLMLLEGLATIHRHSYVHCDLKPENILVFPSYDFKDGEKRTTYQLKICDFGLSKKDGDTKWWKPSRPYAGTPLYMSPESISHGEISKGLDLWSLGCVVLEMFTGKRPWWHKNYDLTDLSKCYIPLIPADLPSDIRLFLMICFAFEPAKRKDALTLLNQFFLPKDDFNKRMDKIWEMIVEIRSIRAC